MKNEILEEINRMKVLGGMLNEAASPTSIIPSLIAKITLKIQYSIKCYIFAKHLNNI